MLRKPLFALFAAVAMGGLSFGQVPGDSMDAVRARLGSPQLSRHSGKKEIWMYRNSVRVTFENGVVTTVTTANARVSTNDSASESQGVGNKNMSATRAPAEAPRDAVNPSPVEYRDTARHIRFALPAGFQRVQPNDRTIVAAWLSAASSNNDPLVVSLAEAPGALRKGPLPPGMLPAGRTSFTINWRGESLNCVRAEESTPNGPFVNLNVILPTGGKVLRLGFAGPKANEQRVRDLVDETLKTLDVTLAYAPPPMDPAERLGMILGSLATMAVVATVVGRMIRRLSNRPPKAPPVLAKSER